MPLENSPLRTFQENNPRAVVTLQEEDLIVAAPWDDGGLMLRVPNDDEELIATLNSVRLNPRFDAILHLDTNTVEFIWGFVDPESDDVKSVCDRTFSVRDNNQEFECRFAEPTSALWQIAKASKPVLSELPLEKVRQLYQFRDFQRLDDNQNAGIRKFFEGRVPRSFFVQSPIDLNDLDLIQLARQLNVLIRIYDLRSPIIVIHCDDDSLPLKKWQPRRFRDHSFPPILNLPSIDDFLLQLLETAQKSRSRYAFLFYYQVCEYAGYYFIDQKLRTSLRQVLMDPAVASKADTKIAEILDLMGNQQGSGGGQKIARVMEIHCDPDVLWREIEHDRDFFSEAVEFEGGLTLDALVVKQDSLETWRNGWTQRLFPRLRDIRNAIAHARESRQVTHILPSEANNRKLDRFVPLISRIAEDLAIKAV